MSQFFAAVAHVIATGYVRGRGLLTGKEFTRAHQTIAAELGLRLIPVGDAFHLADTDPAWGYQPDRQFDFKRPQPPLLPDQTHSLHRGWQWQKKADGTVALGLDGHHAGTAGEYLGACVWYEVLFKESPVGNTFVPPGLSPAEIRFLQETAHRAVLNARTKQQTSLGPKVIV